MRHLIAVVLLLVLATTACSERTRGTSGGYVGGGVGGNVARDR